MLLEQSWTSCQAHPATEGKEKPRNPEINWGPSLQRQGQALPQIASTTCPTHLQHVLKVCFKVNNKISEFRGARVRTAGPSSSRSCSSEVPLERSMQCHSSLCQEPPGSRTNSIVWVLYKSQKDDSGCPYSPSLASQSQG